MDRDDPGAPPQARDAILGIGPLTLYKYFPDVEAILLAWVRTPGPTPPACRGRDRGGDAGERLEAVLKASALIRHRYVAERSLAWLVGYGGRRSATSGAPTS